MAVGWLELVGLIHFWLIAVINPEIEWNNKQPTRANQARDARMEC